MVGSFDPSPATAPVVLLTVELPPDIDATHAALVHAKDEDSGCYLEILSDAEARLTTDHGREIPLLGERVFATETGYDAQDFERLAKRNYDWGLLRSEPFESNPHVWSESAH